MRNYLETTRTHTYSLLFALPLLVLYGTGIRISELVGLSLADVDLDGALLRAFGKGAKERLVPFNESTQQAVRAWLRDRAVICHNQSVDALFVNFRGTRLTGRSACSARSVGGLR